MVAVAPENMAMFGFCRGIFHLARGLPVPGVLLLVQPITRLRIGIMLTFVTVMQSPLADERVGVHSPHGIIILPMLSLNMR
jgi:hypothetical protein